MWNVVPARRNSRRTRWAAHRRPLQTPGQMSGALVPLTGESPYPRPVSPRLSIAPLPKRLVVRHVRCIERTAPMVSFRHVALALFAVPTAGGCSTPPLSPPPTLTAVSITGPSTIRVGQFAFLTITGRYSDGHTETLNTFGSAWSSSSPAATVSSGWRCLWSVSRGCDDHVDGVFGPIGRTATYGELTIGSLIADGIDLYLVPVVSSGRSRAHRLAVRQSTAVMASNPPIVVQ